MADQKWPAWRYGPNEGDERIFQKDEVVPSGWTDSPKTARKKAAAATPPRGRKPKDDKDPNTDSDPNAGKGISAEDRAATITSLREAGVEIADDASDDEITAAFDELTKNTQE